MLGAVENQSTVCQLGPDRSIATAQHRYRTRWTRYATLVPGSIAIPTHTTDDSYGPNWIMQTILIIQSIHRRQQVKRVVASNSIRIQTLYAPRVIIRLLPWTHVICMTYVEADYRVSFLSRICCEGWQWVGIFFGNMIACYLI